MTKRACDTCRRRKVKCDFAPGECTSCRIAGLECSYLILPKKRGPPKATSVRVKQSPPGPDVSSPRTLSSLSPGSGAAPDPSLKRPSWHQLVGVAPEATSPSFSSHGSEISITRPRPAQQFGVSTWPNTSIPDARDSAAGVHSKLVSIIKSTLPSHDLQHMVDTCITLFIQNIFPIAPHCHEPTLRINAARFFSGPAAEIASPGVAQSSPLSSDDNPKAHIASLRAFTLITGICANIATQMPESLLPIRDLICDPFYQASRTCLKLFEDYDLEHPNSSSIAIRCMHAAVLHKCGRTGPSWHVLGQGILLANEMVSHRESSLVRNSDPLEAQLLRYGFWTLHMYNRSAAILNNRPILLREALFDPPPNIPFLTPDPIPLLETTQAHNAPPFEQRILIGTDLLCRLWSAAANLVMGVKELSQRYPHQMVQGSPALTDLMRSYVGFAGILDDLPPWLQSPDTVVVESEQLDAAGVAYQRGAFWRQKVDVTVTFHCLRMVLLQRCAEYGLVSVMGLSDEPIMLAMRTAEIARDCLDTVDTIPLQYLQVNGEPLVEKIRQIGSALLKLSQNTEDDMIRDRAKAYLARLLNVLAGLDSRAVDELNNEQG